MYKVRRVHRVMPEERAWALLGSCEYGVLSTSVGEQPYGVPLSYALMGDTVCFHCAQVGRKIDNIKVNPQVCFTVVGRVKPVYDGDFSTYYESVVAFGAVVELEGEQKVAALEAICQKYLPEHMGDFEGSVQKSIGRTAVYAIKISHITGKEKKPAD